MRVFWGRRYLAVLIALVAIVGFCAKFVESRPWSLRSILKVPYYPSEVFTGQYLDYEYQDFIQGPRRRRWALPADVQNTRCLPGERLHSSGYGCVPIDEEDDDY